MWDRQLITHGAWLTQVRAKVTAEISKIADNYARALSEGTMSMKMKYVPSGDENVGIYEEKLDAARHIDAERYTTSVGPHRDDIYIELNDTDARYYASSGEKKTAALALKMAEADFITGVTGEKPILLLDDVFSSLDIRRSRALLSVASDSPQSIITLTDLNILKQDIKSGAKFYEVRQGRMAQAA
jgi:DNA replication and repair protein RecF